MRPRNSKSFFYQVWQIFRFFSSNSTSYFNLLFLISFSVFEEILIYQLGIITSKFYFILLSFDLERFYYQILFTTTLIIFMAIVKSAKNYITTALCIDWRDNASKILIGKYITNNNYRKLKSCSRVDNEDQRISQDMDRTCTELSKVVSQVILTPFTIAYYSVQVYINVGINGLLFIIFIFLISQLVNKSFGKSIAHWSYLRGKHDGDYRDELKNIQNIAAVDDSSAKKDTPDSQVLHDRLVKALTNLLSVCDNLALRQFYLDFSTTIFDYSGSVLSFLIIAVPIFTGKYSNLTEAQLSQKISASAFICLYLMNCFSKIVTITSNIGQINGFGSRVTELSAALDTLDDESAVLLETDNTQNSDNVYK